LTSAVTLRNGDGDGYGARSWLTTDQPMMPEAPITNAWKLDEVAMVEHKMLKMSRVRRLPRLLSETY
jgi:hypothetical protein